jgi:hypothetical protein
MRQEISIWFFCGVLLLSYGLVIFVEGIWELFHPLANPPVLYNLHAAIWWGAFLWISGLTYTLKFRPRRT